MIAYYSHQHKTPTERERKREDDCKDRWGDMLLHSRQSAGNVSFVPSSPIVLKDTSFQICSMEEDLLMQPHFHTTGSPAG